MSAFFVHRVDNRRKLESDKNFPNLLSSFEVTHVVARQHNGWDILIGDLNYPLIYDEGAIAGKSLTNNRVWSSECYGKLRHFLVRRDLRQKNRFSSPFDNLIDVFF